MFLGRILIAATLMGACSLDGQPLETAFTSDGENDLSLVSYNTWLHPTAAFRKERRDLMIPLLEKTSADVIVLQEVLVPEFIPGLLNGLKRSYPNQSKVLGESSATMFTYNGGVVVLSKHPIEVQKEHIFKNSGGPFRFANMGVLYARIRKQDPSSDGQVYHIFATHMAGLNEEYAALRSKQRKEMKAFVEAQNIPKDEPVFMVGDFNADYYTKEYDDLLAELGDGTAPAEHGLIVGMPEGPKPLDPNVTDDYPQTWDSAHNHLADDGKRQWIDWGLWRPDHLEPASASMEQGSFRGEYDKLHTDDEDLSDHHPIFIRFTLK